MKKQIILIVCIILSFETFSQNLIWEKLINYLPNQESINSVSQESDSSFIFCGTAAGKTFFAKAKLNGDTLWKKNKNVNTCYTNEHISVLPNGEFIHFGSKDVYGSCSQVNFLFQKLDPDGTVSLSWDYGDNGKQNILQDYTFLPGGGFLASGMRESSLSYYLSLMKLDNLGNQLWYKKYKDGTYTTGIIVNRKGNYMLRGSSADQPFLSVYHPYFLEVNPSGDSIQSKYLIVHADTVDEIMDNWGMLQNKDGNYLFSIRIDSVQSRLGTILNRYSAVVLMDSLFNIKWRTYLKPVSTSKNYPSRIVELKDSTFIVIVSNSDPEGSQFYLYKISKSGTILNKQIFTSTICNKVNIIEIEVMSDSSMIVSGYCNDGQSAYIARIGSVGLPQVIDTCASFKASFKAEQEGDSIIFTNTSNGGYAYATTSSWKFSDSTVSTVFNPKFEVTGTVDSVWARLITTNPAGCRDTIERKVKVTQLTSITDPAGNQEWKVVVYPNPSSDVFNFKNTGNNSTSYTLSIISSIGEEVGYFYYNSREFTVNTHLSSGMYFYLLTDEKGNRRSGKLVVE